jgi:ribosome-associated toxin RatA of RatAB toxin-antitoxin module
VRAFILLSFALLCSRSAVASDLAGYREQRDDVSVAVALDGAEQSGHATASVRIHAPPEVIWSLITDCGEALKMVPGLVDCSVMETAPDQSWQLIRHVLDYSLFLRRLTYVLRATYEKPFTISVARVSGDLKSMNFTWHLESDGDYTVANYAVDLAPGFWVPQWLVRGALRRDLPKMLRTLRARAETMAQR